MHLILDTYGTTIDREDFRFKITSDKHERIIAPRRISSISIFKNASISTAAILLAVETNIPVIIFNRQGKPAARLWSSYYGSIATIRRNQVLFAMDLRSIEWLLNAYRMKTAGQCGNLHWLAEQRPSIKNEMEQAITLMSRRIDTKDEFENLEAGKNAVMNLDATISKYYWEALSLAMKNNMPFEKRSRQPAQDHFNAIINYLYGMLYSVVEGAVITAGLDPQLGFLHADEYNEPTFVFDCIEPFRPWTDRLALELILQKKLNSACFEKYEGEKAEEEIGFWLSRQGKQIIIPAFFDCMKQANLFNNRRIKREDQIRAFCTQLAQRLKEPAP